MLTGSTSLYGLLAGKEQVSKSLSPQIHNAAFATLDIDAIYVPLGVDASAINQAVHGLIALGFKGFNVTMPHKTAVADIVDELIGDARAIGAVNTVLVENGRSVGYNTDARGLVQFIERDLGLSLKGRSAAVLGAGGAAAAAVFGLEVAGVSSVTVSARRAEQAARLSRLVRSAEFDTAEFGQAVADIVVNATPAGQEEGDALPLDPAHLGEASLIVDLVYHRQTKLVERARESGVQAHNGLGILVRQAALAFEIFTGTDAPIDVMRQAAGFKPDGTPAEN